MPENIPVNDKRSTVNGGGQPRDPNREPFAVNHSPGTVKRIDTKWDDTEIVFSHMTPDTKFLFDRMTEVTLDAVAAAPDQCIMDLACGRAIDAFKLALKGATVFGLDPSDTMLAKALEWIAPKPHPVVLIRSLAEKVPFPDSSFDKLVCKGAIDHFANLDASLEEIFRILKPRGKLIISVANFESLSCKLGRAYDRAYEKLKNRKRSEHPFWVPPDDHNFKFDCAFLLKRLEPRFSIEMVQGLSLFWCLPYWGATLEKLKPKTAEKILKLLDGLASLVPSLSDVLVIRAVPRK